MITNMKKLIALAFVVGISVATFAAFEFGGVKAVKVFAPTTISAGSTNSVALTAGGFKGTGEVIVNAGAAENRTSLDVALYTTNAVAGGWTLLASKSSTATNDVIVRVSFPGEYLTKDIKVSVGSIGAATSASALILTH